MALHRKNRVLIAKPGLDGHDRGAKILALALRDAGFEVIYTGVRQDFGQIIGAIIQEDPQVVLLSCLSGAHQQLFDKIMQAVKKNDLTDKLYLAGGIIPERDYEFLESLGIARVFGTHDDLDEIIAYIQSYFATQE
ncbi:MAG TPA: methylmalonyl-CoA mutase [Candidatus Wirthbacteria bacterium]|nr:methylmalonyl-CoA mutase [Candidatus Wirthbacteria bacterium]